MGPERARSLDSLQGGQTGAYALAGLGAGRCVSQGLLELFGLCYNFSIPAVSRLATAPAPRPRGEPRLPSQDQDNKSQRGLVSVPAPSVRTC